MEWKKEKTLTVDHETPQLHNNLEKKREDEWELTSAGVGRPTCNEQEVERDAKNE